MPFPYHLAKSDSDSIVSSKFSSNFQLSSLYALTREIALNSNGACVISKLKEPLPVNKENPATGSKI